MHRNVKRAATAALSAGALVLLLAAPAAAATPSEPLATGLIGPLGLSVGPQGDVFVAEAFAGLLSRFDEDGGEKQVVASFEGGEIAGVDASRSSQTAYVRTGGSEETGPQAELVRLDHKGRSIVVADLQAYEQEENPDAGVHYGFDGLSASCADEVPEWLGGGEGYPGIVEAHPYAVANVPGGWVVADAAGNSLISVRRNGDVSTLAVLPAHVLTLTAEHIAAVNSGLPEGMEPVPACVEGHDYAFEAVPTDVEIGRDGLLYVSTLAGGPEDPSLGARSKVFSVDRRGGGTVTELASGFAGATDLAVAPDGTIYVAELFGGQISTVVDEGPQSYAEVPFPSTVEFSHGQLYSTIDVFNEEDGGSLVTIPADSGV